MENVQQNHRVHQVSVGDAVGPWHTDGPLQSPQRNRTCQERDTDDAPPQESKGQSHPVGLSPWVSISQGQSHGANTGKGEATMICVC